MSLISGWYDLHAELGWKMGKVEFINYLFPHMDTDKTETKEKNGKEAVNKYVKQNIYRAEYYNGNVSDEFHALKGFIADEYNKSEIYKSLHDYVQKVHRHGCMNGIREKLVYLLDHTDIHDRGLSMKLIDEFEHLENGNYKQWTNCLFYYLYFAVTDKLHQDIGYEKYLYLKRDLQEYEKNVLMRYGGSGISGIETVFAMANREEPNIIALYEMGGMEFYGRGPSGKVDYETAYKYYSKVLKLNKSHPLALWSIAYMKFTYKQEGYPLQNARIAELDKEYPDKFNKSKSENWYQDIIYKADLAYSYGCAAAANLIGRIIESDDSIFPNIYKGKYQHRKAEEFYKESADNQYAFGCNNYARKCLEKAEQCGDTVDKVIYLKEAIKYYEMSAETGNPWALNRMARYYVTGFLVGNNNVIKKDEDRAYDYFSKAANFADLNCYYWPIINLCKYFYCNKESQYYNAVGKTEITKLLKNAKVNLLEKGGDQLTQIDACMEIICQR